MNGLGPTDFALLFSTIFGDVQSVRASRGLPPLVSVHLGHEYVSRTEAPPRIIVVPTRTEYSYVRNVGAQPTTGKNFQGNPRAIWLRTLWFEAHFWGDEIPSGLTTGSSEQDTWYSFSSTIELEREFLGALMRNVGNDPAVRFRGGEWRQRTDDARLGRLLVLEFGFWTPVTDEPWVALPFKQSASATSGVDIAIDVQVDFPDGTTVDQGTIDVP